MKNLSNLPSAVISWLSKRTQGNMVTDKPVPQAANAISAAKDSIVGVRGWISYSNIKKALTDLTSEPYSADGTDSFKYKKYIDAGIFGKHKAADISIGYRFEYTVQRNGPITIQQNGDKVRVMVPITAKGNVGLRGDGARILGLSSKNAEASLTATLDLRFDVDENWCPVVHFDLTHTWTTPPRLEILNNVNIEMSGKADELINKLKQDAQLKLTNALDCTKIKQQLAEQWHSYSFPVNLPNNQILYLNLEPKSLAFSGMTAEAERLGIALRLTARMSLDSRAFEPQKLSLPQLQRVQWAPGQIQIEIPIRIAYSQLIDAAQKELTKQPFETKTPLGPITVTVKNVTIYPSHDRVVVGLNFSANVPTSFLSVAGDVYLACKPGVSSSGTEVFLTDVSFSRVLDNRLWSTLSIIFDGQIKAAIEKYARYDFAADLEEIQKQLPALLEDPTRVNGLKIIAKNPEFLLRGIFPETDNLTVVGALGTEVDAEILPDLLNR